MHWKYQFVPLPNVTYGLSMVNVFLWKKKEESLCWYQADRMRKYQVSLSQISLVQIITLWTRNQFIFQWPICFWCRWSWNAVGESLGLMTKHWGSLHSVILWGRWHRRSQRYSSKHYFGLRPSFDFHFLSLSFVNFVNLLPYLLRWRHFCTP